MFGAPIKVSETVFNDGDRIVVPLERAAVDTAMFMELALSYTIAAGNKTANEDGWGALIQSLQLVPSGDAYPLNLSGYSAIQAAEVTQGSQLPTETLPVTGAASHTARLVLPIYPFASDAPNPLAAGYDNRGLAAYDLVCQLRALDTVLTAGGALSAISGTARVTEYLADQLPPLNVPVRYLTESVRVSAGTVPYDIDINQGGALRRLILISRTAAPLAGTRGDDRIASVGVMLNGTRQLIQQVPWQTLKAIGGNLRDDALDVGVGILTPDSLGLASSDTMIPAGGAGVSSLKLQVTPAADCHLTIVSETWRRR